MLVPIGEFIVTKDIVDRDSERVLPSGANLENFKKNPIMFYNHMRWDGGIGTWDNIKVSDGEISMFGYVSDSTEYSKEKLGLVQDGVIRTASMGFRPKKWSDDSKDKLAGQLGVTILEYEVIEVSITDVPANPDAVMKSMDKKEYKVYSDFKSWQEDKEGVIVKSFQIENFNNMNILSVVNKFLGTSFGEDAKPEDVEAAFKKMSEQKGMSQEAVEKSMKEFADVSKSFVKSEIETATKALKEEIEVLKGQMKELKEDNGNPDGDEDEDLDDAKPKEKSDNIIDVTKFFTK
jgi:HK97 family phage prohead protease